jgi:hypothetical protein
MSYVWNELEEHEGEKAAKEETLGMCGERMAFFPDLRDWIVQFIETEKALISSKDKLATNMFLVSILKLVQSLVLFGYFTNVSDITKV